MSAQNPNEIWQVEVGGQVYEAPFGELGIWIDEGSLQPGDKVRKGNLRWIEARRVPSLVPFFNAKERGLPLPMVVSTTEAPQPEAPRLEPVVAQNFVPEVSLPSAADPIAHSIAIPTEQTSSYRDPNFCAVHTNVPTVFACDGCATGFCKTCPKAYGGSVRICPLCGSMCRTLSEVQQKQAQTVHRVSAIAEGFGGNDFFRALSHPFQYKTSLFFGALMFMAFSLGKSASALGGMYMMTSAIFCTMLANMLTFGVLANTIGKFSHGELEANFMPSFEDFDLWDDVIHPFFLSIGAYVSSFGPFIVVLVIGFYFVASSVASEMETFQQNVEKIPGTHYYDSKRTFEQSERVKGVLGDMSEKQAARIDEIDDLGEADEPDETVSSAEIEDPSRRESREQEELWEMAQKSRAQSLEAAFGKSPDTEAKEKEAMLQGFLNLAAPLVVIGAIFFLWGVFYFPVACAVAGYTRSFTATINPVVGLDTIKRLGGTYFKILLMGLALVIASGIVSVVTGVIFAPLDLPAFGNIPANAIGALVAFYLWVVFSCILGYALFKNSDKLQIHS
ncbi:MAG TPA: hypothetical protein VFZ23_03490 [Pyrinomonadaceae bacterium]